MRQVTGDWLSRPATQAVFDAFEHAGHRIYVVGGCVRNALLDEAVSDIDMSTDARPERSVEVAEGAGLKAVPTGIDHGTITVVSGGVPHEVTTFRRDVETDGRRAVVAYSDRIEEDAARRDFTINALYADRAGRVLDPQGGLADIAARRVRFIGDAEERIREDYLRSLRFFRFHARYADPEQGFDADALSAIAGNLEGLAGLSRERVGAEMLKLLSVADPALSAAVMGRTGALGQVLPGADPTPLGPLVTVEAELALAPDAIRRLAAIAGAEVAQTLRLSKAQMRALTTLRTMAFGAAAPAELGYRLGVAQATSVCALRHALLGTPSRPATLADVERGAAAKFPVRALDLQGEHSGPGLGEALRALEAKWIASGFTLTRAELLG
jgi:poly(A) polymerase